jgi:hypothetical protein
MAIPTTIEELSTTAASNGPSGSDQRNTADDGLRAAYAFIRMLVSQGSDVASASSITPASTGAVFDITGTTSITALASTNSWDGRRVLLQFDGILTLTHSSNLALPGSVNITTAAGDVAEFLQRGSGAWRLINYQPAGGSALGFSAASGKTLTASNSLTLAGTDGTTITFPSTSTTFAFAAYTPTVSDHTNVSSVTTNAAMYARLGNFVIVFGTILLQVDSAAASSFQLSLPVASNMSASTHLSGHASDGTGSAHAAVKIAGNTTNDTAQFNWTDNTPAFQSRQFGYSFMYQII